MHDPLYDRVEAGKALETPFPGGGPSLAEYILRGLASLPIQLEPPKPDPAFAAQRARYQMNRAERRALDRQESS